MAVQEPRSQLEMTRDSVSWLCHAFYLRVSHLCTPGMVGGLLAIQFHWWDVPSQLNLNVLSCHSGFGLGIIAISHVAPAALLALTVFYLGPVTCLLVREPPVLISFGTDRESRGPKASLHSTSFSYLSSCREGGGRSRPSFCTSH